MQSEQPGRALTQKETMTRVGVKSTTTLARWIDKLGFPKPYKVGDSPSAHNRFDEAEVMAWLAARRSQRGAEAA